MPVDSPCRIRQARRITPAHTPMTAWVGSRAMTVVVRTMDPMDSSMTSRRPSRSASVPNTTAPNGRAANPTAKTARADMVDDRLSVEGKNCGPMEDASRP